MQNKLYPFLKKLVNATNTIGGVPLHVVVLYSVQKKLYPSIYKRL